MRIKNWHVLAVLGGLLVWLAYTKKRDTEANQVGSSSESPNISVDNAAAEAIRTRKDLVAPRIYREDAAISGNSKLAQRWTGLTRARRGGTLDVTRYGPMSPGTVRVIR